MIYSYICSWFHYVIFKLWSKLPTRQPQFRASANQFTQASLTIQRVQHCPALKHIFSSFYRNESSLRDCLIELKKGLFSALRVRTHAQIRAILLQFFARCCKKSPFPWLKYLHVCQINTPYCRNDAPPPFYRLASKNLHSRCWAALLIFCGWAVRPGKSVRTFSNSHPSS